ILDRPSVEATGFKRRGDTARSTAGPAKDAIERVPPVIEQDAAACQRRNKAPVYGAIGSGRDRGSSTQSAPADRSDGTYRTIADQLRDLGADRCLEPIVNRVHDAPGARRRRSHGQRILPSDDQRLLTEDVQTAVQCPF